MSAASSAAGRLAPSSRARYQAPQPPIDDAQPRQEDPAELERQGGEEEMERKEGRSRAVAPVGAPRELVGVPERQPAGAHLVAKKEEPGLDLPGDVPQVGIARRRIGDPLPGGLRGEGRGGAGDAVREAQRRPEQGDARKAAGGPGNADLPPAQEKAGEREQGEERKGGVHGLVSGY